MLFATTAQTLSAVFTGVTALVVSVATCVAWRNLRIIAKNQDLQAIRDFFSDFEATYEDRQLLFEAFDFSQDGGGSHARRRALYATSD